MAYSNIYTAIKNTVIIFTIFTAFEAFANTEPSDIESQIEPTIQIQPITAQEIKAGLELMQNKINSRIEVFGKSLSADDFEWTWRGRQLNQQKRREVCEIFQGVVDEFYQMALKNKARLTEQDQALLNNRNAFIERLGYKNNIVETNMGFDCRIR